MILNEKSPLGSRAFFVNGMMLFQCLLTFEKGIGAIIYLRKKFLHVSSPLTS